jgi:hypothetical protein
VSVQTKLNNVQKVGASNASKFLKILAKRFDYFGYGWYELPNAYLSAIVELESCLSFVLLDPN